MGAAPTKTKVLKYLSEHAGHVVFREDIAKATGLSEHQIKTAMYGLSRTGYHNIRVEAPGNAWIYYGPVGSKDTIETLKRKAGLTPEPTPEPEKSKPSKPGPKPSLSFRDIGLAMDGSHILRDSNGNMWRATPL